MRVAPLARGRLPPAFLGALLLAAALGVPGAAPAAHLEPRTVAAYGDVGLTDAARDVRDTALALGAEGFLGLGDYDYEAYSGDWKAMMEPLTSRGAWLALGNHDVLDRYRSLMPTGKANWSTVIGGVRVIALNTQQSLWNGSSQMTWLLEQLQKPEPDKVLVMHKPWWLQEGATHPGREFRGSAKAMDRLVREHGVDLIIAGHEHNYQRNVRNEGATYIVAGTGGHSLKPVNGSASGLQASCACYGLVLLTLEPGNLQGRFVTREGEVLDSFAVEPQGASASGGPSAAFQATFDPRGVGNDWWVEAKVGANEPLAAVHASRDGGGWSSLARTSWGTWARSLHAPDGTAVRFQATSADGERVVSGPVAWT